MSEDGSKSAKKTQKMIDQGHISIVGGRVKCVYCKRDIGKESIAPRKILVVRDLGAYSDLCSGRESSCWRPSHRNQELCESVQAITHSTR